MNEKWTFSKRAASFGYAFRGLAALLREEPNARIHLLASVLVVSAAFVLAIDASGWRWLSLAITAVWLAEAFNTAIERIADAAVPEPHPLIGEAKDVAAGGVLIAAFFAALIGLSILGPAFLRAWARLS
ncbi:MAG: hypothetical protein CBC48_00205 [bacterium TMED88]|nr:diacylglycerol kinase [Deltaproteobacteria bacterium]OUV37607.1 MAG: hypothetical protein CBC48_00205 [bacterium TMED88]